MNGRRLRIPSLSIIFILLFAATSVKGQTAEGLDALEQALRWEKVVFTSEDQDRINDALLQKAGCYAAASMPEEALKTLDRIPLYMLDRNAAGKVLLLKSELCRETGDFGAALGYLEESGKAADFPERYAVLLALARRYEESLEQSLICTGNDETRSKAVSGLFRKAPGLKNESTATLLSSIPPLGQIYLGKPAEGIASMALNAGAAGFTVWQLIGHNWITGILGGGILLNETFLKANMARNVSGVEEANRAASEEFARSLENLLDYHYIHGSNNR